MHAGMTLPVLNNTSNKRKQLFSSISPSQDNEMILTAEKDKLQAQPLSASVEKISIGCPLLSTPNPVNSAFEDTIYND